MAIFAFFANNMYILLNERSAFSSFWHKYWQIPIFISVASFVLVGTFKFVFYIFLSCFFISLIKTLMNGEKFFIFLTFMFSLACILYYFKLKMLVLLSFLIIVFYSTYKKHGYKRIEYFNFLPVARDNISKTLGVLLAFLFSFAYLLDLDGFAINILIQAFMVVSLIFITSNMEIIDRGYEEMKSFYLLAQYIEQERDEFSRLLHDEIIQDVKAGRNLLGLKEPNIQGSKDILKNLEHKCRQFMNFYSSNLFDYFSFEENFENMLISLKKLYPNKNIEIDWTIDEEISKKTNKIIKQKIMQISKELINNVYRHSEASFINYSCKIINKSIKIECESDGASKADYGKIQNSKGGVLILRVLVRNNQGEISYIYRDGLLKTDIKLRM